MNFILSGGVIIGYVRWRSYILEAYALLYFHKTKNYEFGSINYFSDVSIGLVINVGVEGYMEDVF